jgi:hypothetical protein
MRLASFKHGGFMYTPSIGAEVAVTAYNGTSSRTARTESSITGEVTKITAKYLWVRDYRDGSIWKAPRFQFDRRFS